MYREMTDSLKFDQGDEVSADMVKAWLTEIPGGAIIAPLTETRGYGPGEREEFAGLEASWTVNQT